MKSLTKREQLRNCEIALFYWKTVPRGNVIPNLKKWRSRLTSTKHTCGTIACFGGWLPAMPEFATMGVKSSKFDGAPYIGDDEYSRIHFGTDNLADHLFGNHQMFNPAQTGGEHQTVTKRLEKQIDYLEKINSRKSHL